MPRSFTRRRAISVLVALFITLIIVVIGAVSWGAAGWSLDPSRGSFEIIIWQIRLPRAILAILVGASLAVAGVVYQALFKNPMADPYILGVSAGAGLGASLGIMLHVGQSVLGLYATPILAFVGGLGTIILVYQIARVGGRVPMMSLLLAGLALSVTLAALMSLVMVLGGKDMQTVVFWLMGGLSAATWDKVKMALPFAAVGLVIPFLYMRELNAMLLGEERAQNLGVDTERVRGVLLVAASMMTAAAVAVSGLIGFIGMMVPHIVRLIVGPEHKWLLPASLLSGATLLLLTDTLARSVMRPVEIPVGIVTAILGGPFFLFLLFKKRGSF
ncbi:MAG: iron ABC transporter permease [Actinomycetota bacterium]